MADHTPGPWQAGRPDMATVVDGVSSKWVYAGDQHVAVASGMIAGPWDEVMANARLIAAAPDLLSELRKLEWSGTNFDEHCCPECLADFAQGKGQHRPDCTLAAAIAKATGAPTPSES